MRFEMSSSDIIGLVSILHSYLDKLINKEPYWIGLAERFCRKLKVYAESAFENREQFRNQIKELQNKIEATRTRLFGNHFTLEEDKNGRKK